MATKRQEEALDELRLATANWNRCAQDLACTGLSVGCDVVVETVAINVNERGQEVTARYAKIAPSVIIRF